MKVEKLECPSIQKRRGAYTILDINIDKIIKYIYKILHIYVY